MIYKLIMIEAVILGMQFVLYFGSEVLQQQFLDVKRDVDLKIPMVPAFAYIYVQWFPMVALFPLFLYFASPDDYVRYQTAIIVSNIASTLIYLAFPTTFRRNDPPGTFAGRSLAVIYKCDFKGCNCSPSLHCIQCYIVAVTALICTNVSAAATICVVALAAGIVASTLLTKQHVVLDVLTAIPVAAASYCAGWIVFNNYPEITELLKSYIG